MTRGPRILNGYQFPTTDAAGGRRGPVIARETAIGPHAATVTMTAIEGGRPKLEIAALWTAGKTSHAVSELQADPETARRRFRLFCTELAAGREPPR
jgi:hypothetical protein